MANVLKCVVCKADFQPKKKNQVTCSTLCSINRYRRAPDVALECAQCHITFTGHISRRFCKVACRELFYEIVRGYSPVCVDVPVTTQCSRCGVEFEGPAGREYCGTRCHEDAAGLAGNLTEAALYVYLWFDKGAQLPYYVGSGGGTRSHDKHGSLRDPHAVVIARSGLTGEGALLIESTLIEFCLLLGAKLENSHNPLVRQERPPLTI